MHNAATPTPGLGVLLDSSSSRRLLSRGVAVLSVGTALLFAPRMLPRR